MTASPTRAAPNSRPSRRAAPSGLNVHPVWNKSNREHTIIHSEPDDVRAEADAAVRALDWSGAYYVDADHIGLKTVDRFIAASDFYTLDVADFTGKPADAASVDAFVDGLGSHAGSLSIPGIAAPLALGPEAIRAAAGKFLLAIQEAGRIYRHIEEKKGSGNFVTEVSIDETDSPQNPAELFLILAMIAREGIPAQTVAPKFTGRFNKGVDYVGDLAQFEKEFDEDLAVIAYAVREFGLPETLKLSVHSGSDKFSIYPIINRLVKKHGCGLHVKTAGTTWLEEVIGLAEAGGDGLSLAREIYAGAYGRFDELTGPYATVIDVKKERLPHPKTGRRLEFRRVRQRPAPRSEVPGVQPGFPAVDPRGVQGRGRDGHPLHRRAPGQRGHHRAQRHAQPLRAPSATHLRLRRPFFPRASMQYRKLGHTGLDVSVLGFGGSSLGNAFREIDDNEGVRTVHAAIDHGINLIDTAPFYGLTKAETVLGKALREIPREKYLLATKVARYGYKEADFDFSAARVTRSVDESLARLGVDHVDFIQIHDMEFGSVEQIITETIPALREVQRAGKARYVGITCLPLPIFRRVMDRVEVDQIQSYCHYCLNDTSLGGLVPYLQDKGVAIFQFRAAGDAAAQHRGAAGLAPRAGSGARPVRRGGGVLPGTRRGPRQARAAILGRQRGHPHAHRRHGQPEAHPAKHPGNRRTHRRGTTRGGASHPGPHPRCHLDLRPPGKQLISHQKPPVPGSLSLANHPTRRTRPPDPHDH